MFPEPKCMSSHVIKREKSLGFARFVDKDDCADAISVTAHSDSTASDLQEEGLMTIAVVAEGFSGVSSVSGGSTTTSSSSYGSVGEFLDPGSAPVARPVHPHPRRKMYTKRCSVPSNDPDQTSTDSPHSVLSTPDRQALWLIWSTLQIHADAVQYHDETGAVGKLMVRKLYRWDAKRMRQCLQCPPDGRGGVLADMARHILAFKMGNLCSNILHSLVQHDVRDIARELVGGMQEFLVAVLSDRTMEHHRASSPRDWSLLARAWTEAMQECYADIWTPKIDEAWARVITLLLRSIFKVLWYTEADELNEKLEELVVSGGGVV